MIDNYTKIAIATYEHYRKNFLDMPTWEDLSQDKREGFKAAAVHCCASVIEEAHFKDGNVKKFERYRIK